MSNDAFLIPHPTLEWRYIDSHSGLIMPWLTRDCLEWLVKQPVQNWRVWEYGSGYSTFWWSTKAKSVLSIEFDPRWAEITRSACTTSAKNYTRNIEQNLHNGNYDCVVIDGHFRDECTESALRCIKLGGYLIIDNYHQASADWPADAWQKTDVLLQKYTKVVFHQEGHPDWKTLLVQIV